MIHDSRIALPKSATTNRSTATLKQSVAIANFILEGQVEFIVGDEHFLLKAGDSICYRSEQPHGYRNGGVGHAKLIVVNTPPSF